MRRACPPDNSKYRRQTIPVKILPCFRPGKGRFRRSTLHGFGCHPEGLPQYVVEPFYRQADDIGPGTGYLVNDRLAVVLRSIGTGFVHGIDHALVVFQFSDGERAKSDIRDFDKLNILIVALQPQTDRGEDLVGAPVLPPEVAWHLFAQFLRSAAGKPDRLQAEAERTGRRWIRGINKARKFFD